MNRRKTERPKYESHKGIASDPAQNFDPLAGLDEECATEPSGAQTAPIGRPISDKEYRQLKEQARHAVRPPTPVAQVDPASRPGEDEKEDVDGGGKRRR